MHRRTWKRTESEAAALFNAKRFWANSGERFDFEGPHAVGQVKNCRTLSHQSLSNLAVEVEKEGASKGKLGVVVHRVPRGPLLVTMTALQFDAWFSFKERR